MGLDDIRLRSTVDLDERATSIREELIPELETRIELAEQAIENAADDPDADGQEVPPGQLEELRDNLEGQARACERTVEALDGDGEFIIQELMTSETAKLTDDVSEQSLDVDVERQNVDASVKRGYHKVRLLQLAIVDWPEEMAGETDRELGRKVAQVGKLPDHVTDYLYRCCTSLNDDSTEEAVQSAGNLQDYGVPEPEELEVAG